MGTDRRPDFTEENARILQAGLVMGLLGVEALSAGARASGERPEEPVGAFLVRRRLVSAADFRRIAESLESKHLFCAPCGAFERVPRPLGARRCSACGRKLELIEETSGEQGRAERAQLPPAFRDPVGAGRYALGEEIGRGGLGRVVAGQDLVLGREVAVKEMIAGPGSEAVLHRFLREGEIAGRLTHPGIIPVHDVGIREQDGQRIPYFVMTRIPGRDLRGILLALDRARREGPPRSPEDPRAVFTRRRLLGIFQDVCHAVAYAHAHGVIHRDLKPANVMVGEYGEVYVVDWGLAKVTQATDSPDGAPRQTDPPDQEDQPPAKRDQENQDHALTLMGEVLGTPGYMPPEQAQGRAAEADERSDVYGLGAMLYEILTWKPPFAGHSTAEMFRRARSGDLPPPSAMIRDAAPADAPGSPAVPSLEGLVPPELDAIVLKAMAPRREDRYPGAPDLCADVERFLEGEKERERNRLKARRKAEEGQEAVAGLGRLRGELRSAEDALRTTRAEWEPTWPLERKRPMWELERRILALRGDLVRAFTRAERDFQTALEYDRESAEAHAGLADLYWDQFVRQEDAGDRAEMGRYEALLREHDDGRYRERLGGDGTLAVSARAYPCRCLVDGRTVEPGEWEAPHPGGTYGEDPAAPESHPQSMTRRPGFLGYHPLSGRSLFPVEFEKGLGAFEPKGPVRLKIHGAACRTEPLAGARAWLFRFAERDRMLVPALPDLPGAVSRPVDSPAGNGSGGPESRSPGLPPKEVLDRLYDPGSPYRPAEGVYLGTTPIAPFRIPMGSYLLIVAGPASAGREDPEWAPVRVPVLVGRNASESLDVTLYRESEIPRGFVQVPEGPFVFQGDPKVQTHNPRAVLRIGDFFLSKFPVTCEQYLEFLNDPDAAGPTPAGKGIPRKDFNEGHYWPRDDGGTVHLPTEEWTGRAAEPLKGRALRLYTSAVWWDPDWPVCAISWQDSVAFAARRTAREGRVYALPPDIAWEKAARGADGRPFPWGPGDEPLYSNQIQSREGGPGLRPVDSYPVDESPYGVRGLAGNTKCWCLNALGPAQPGWRLIAGGCWLSTTDNTRSCNRGGGMEFNVGNQIGMRLAWVPRL